MAFNFPVNNRAESPRIEHIDAMRGFTMLLVVFYHLIVICINPSGTPLQKALLTFRMPLFFFISGFLAYSPQINTFIFKKKLVNRITGQFIPTLFSFLLFCWTRHSNILSNLQDSFKGGYWFTFVLFLIFAFYIILHFALRNICTKQSFTLIYSIIILLFLLLFLQTRINSQFTTYSAVKTFSLDLIIRYIPFFYFGIVCRINEEKFNQIINHKYITSGIFLLFCIIIYSIINFPQLGMLTNAIRLTSSFLGIIIVYHFFSYYSSYFCQATKTGQILSMIGRNTIQVYFLHYFILFSINDLQFDLAFLSSSWPLEILILFPIAIIFTLLCILISKIVKAFPLIYNIFFGFKAI